MITRAFTSYMVNIFSRALKVKSYLLFFNSKFPGYQWNNPKNVFTFCQSVFLWYLYQHRVLNYTLEKPHKNNSHFSTNINQRTKTSHSSLNLQFFVECLQFYWIRFVFAFFFHHTEKRQEITAKSDTQLLLQCTNMKYVNWIVGPFNLYSIRPTTWWSDRNGC